MPYKRPESVLVVIYSGSEVLLLQRKDDPEFWQSVTGTMEVGEVPIETAYRELAEETGVELKPSSLQIKDCHTQRQYQIRPEWQYRYAPGETVNTEHAFYVEIERNSRITLTEHLSYIWLSKQDAINKAWSPSNKEAIEVCVPEPQR